MKEVLLEVVSDLLHALLRGDLDNVSDIAYLIVDMAENCEDVPTPEEIDEMLDHVGEGL